MTRFRTVSFAAGLMDLIKRERRGSQAENWPRKHTSACGLMRTGSVRLSKHGSPSLLFY